MAKLRLSYQPDHRAGVLVLVQAGVLVALSCFAYTLLVGGEQLTGDPGAGPDRVGSLAARARRLKSRAGGSVRPGEGDVDAYVKAVVDSLPPLTDQQRDLLGLIFRHSRAERQARHPTA